MQPDSLIPDLANPQAWNRYAYVNNSPIGYNDPTGHKPVEDSFCDGSRNQPKECQQLRLGDGGTTSGGNIPLTGTPPVVNSPGTTSSGGGSSPCQEDDDMCWLQQGNKENPQPTIPTDPTQTSPSSTGTPPASTQGANGDLTRRVVEFAAGVFMVEGGLLITALGGLIVTTGLIEIGALTALAPPLIVPSSLHAGPAIVIGGFMALSGVGVTLVGGYLVYQAIYGP